MLKRIRIIGIVTCLVATSLSADIDVPKRSLIGLEGGYNTMDISASDGSYDKNYPLAHIGLKVGAESDSYRAFLSGRYYQGDRFDYMNTLEFSLQYLLNVSSRVNLFLGASVGRLNFKMEDKDKVTRELSSSYIGGDLGANIHLTQSFDIEVGARLTNIDADHLKNNKTYQFDSMIGGYASIIYKYSLD